MKLSGILCFTGGRNTGRAGCPYMPKLVKGDILVPSDWVLPVDPLDTDEEIAANLLLALSNGLTDDQGINADDFINRMQFIGPYEGFDDKSDAPTMQKLPYGKEIKANRGVIRHEHIYDKGGQDYHNSVLSFDNKQDQYKVIRIEGNKLARGARVTDPTTGALTGFTGLELSMLSVYDAKAANFTTEAEFRVALTFANNNELNEDMFAIQTQTNLIAMVEELGVVDVEIIPDGAMVSNVSNLVLKTASGSVNLSDTLGDTLADPLAFIFVNELTGDSVDVVSVTRNAPTKEYIVTFDTGSTGWSATDNAVGGLAPVSDLAALGAEFYESNKVSIEMA